MSLRCFLLTKTDRVCVELRVYDGDRVCIAGRGPHGTYCESITIIDPDAPRSAWVEELPKNHTRARSELVSEDDPRWPLACERCGVPWSDKASRQLNADPLWSGSPDGQRHVLEDCPEGAMWDAEWMHGYDGHYNPADGRSLMVKCPGGGEWNIDGPSTNGSGWTRTGTPPEITVTPSIQTANYHGHLKAGIFEP